MKRFDQAFVEEMKEKLDVELLGVAAINDSSPAELKTRAAALLPGAKSVMVMGKEMFEEVVALLGPSKEAGGVEAGELLGPHGEYLNGRLTRSVYELARGFRKEGYGVLPLPAAGCPMDQRSLTAIFSYKHAAQLAGLGTLGRHTMLLTPQYGPRVRLACLLTTAPVDSSPAGPKDFCAGCDACIRACPAKALEAPAPGEAYAMNKFACRTYRQAGLACGVCLKVCDQVFSRGH